MLVDGDPLADIRVLEDGTVKIMDFGIAKSLEGGSKLTQTGIALGTAGYLAPEQIHGGTIDQRTDIFAVGVVAYELVTGTRPFEGNTLSNVLYRILNEHGEVRERRRQLQHPNYAKPELLATAPNQLWSWDITKLKGPAKWTLGVKEVSPPVVASWM